MTERYEGPGPLNFGQNVWFLYEEFRVGDSRSFWEYDAGVVLRHENGLVLVGQSGSARPCEVARQYLVPEAEVFLRPREAEEAWLKKS